MKYIWSYINRALTTIHIESVLKAYYSKQEIGEHPIENNFNDK